jgi:hypothetical protein
MAKGAAVSVEKVVRDNRRYERHEGILRALSRHRLLSSHQIDRIDGGSGQKLRKKILPQLLEHRYVKKKNLPINHPYVYALDNRGVHHLSTRCGIPRNLIAHHPRGGEFIGHTLLTADIMIALEQACEASDQVEFIPAEEVLLDYAPIETRETTHGSPFSWPISYTLHDITIEKPIVPDKIFGMRLLDQSQEEEHAWFFCVEADTGSETIHPRNLKKSLQHSTTWLGKSLQYKATHQGKVFAHRYGVQAFRVLLVTKPQPETRLREMMNTTLFAYDGFPTRLFLFTTIDKINETNPLEFDWLQADGSKKKLVED